MGCLIFNSLSELPRPFGPCAITIGNFDGVHAGHRVLIGRVIEIARRNGWRAAALTFHPHPAKVVKPDKTPPLLTTMAERAALMCQLGLDAVVVLPFTAEVARMSADEFARRIVVGELGARAVVIGDNFRFGHGAAGNAATLSKIGAECGFFAQVIPPVRCRGRVVSSSEVRQAVTDGRIALAWRLLGRPYSLEGEVVSGAGIGAKQMVPTLNLAPPVELQPADGIYVTRTREVENGRKWDSITYVGFRPTFDGEDRRIETYLLGTLEGQSPRRIRIEFLSRLRDDRRFDSVEALKHQILRDVARAQEFHRRARRFQSVPGRIAPVDERDIHSHPAG